ncbi:MAG: hypothetical protein FJZ15_00325 [Candidatus Omnitrophica bacterium]|nr:hypothetical protein [Candidatus Omnitrophota bacterium]
MLKRPLLLRNKGIALFLSLAVAAIVIVLANIIMNIMLSQSKLTHHQIGRIQAYYAGLAGINLALENLRTGTWHYSGGNTCQNAGDCPIADTAFPNSVQSVEVIFCPPGIICAPLTTICNPPAGINFCINSSVTYSSN